MRETPVIGISACLLGKKVRYNGEHRLDTYLRFILRRSARWIPLCPEVESGLPVPREPMVLAGRPESLQIVTINTGIDHTERIIRWSESKLMRLSKKEIHGFIFKSRSPSCGLSVNISGTDQKASGLFASAFKKRFPEIPVTEEERLYNPGERRVFFEKVLAFQRWKDIRNKRDLLEFHKRDELILLSRGDKESSHLADVLNLSYREARERYLDLLMKILDLKVTPEKELRVLQKILYKLKDLLSPKEYRHLQKKIQEFRAGKISLRTLLSILRYYSELHSIEELINQYYLSPQHLEIL